MRDNIGFNPVNQEQEILLTHLIKKHSLKRIETQILDVAQNCVSFERAPYGDLVECNTLIGGLPLVPQNWQWPEGMLFLAQIGLKEITHYDYNHLFPSSGFLNFFLGSDFGGNIPNHVEYLPENAGPFDESETPEGYIPVGDDSQFHVVYDPCFLRPFSSINLPNIPSYDAYRIWPELLKVSDESDYSAQLPDYIQEESSYCDLLDAVEKLNSQDATDTAKRARIRSGHHIFGYAGYPGNAAVDACFYSFGLEPEFHHRGLQVSRQKKWLDAIGRDTDRGKKFLWYLEHKDEVDSDIGNWMLLLQIGSYDAGMMWGDAGTVHFMIRRQDLEARHFDRTYAGITTS